MRPGTPSDKAWLRLGCTSGCTGRPLYLTTNQGLAFDPSVTEHGIVLVNSDLTDSQWLELDITPDGGYLWSMGRQTIAHFDGETWQHIPFPYS